MRSNGPNRPVAVVVVPDPEAVEVEVVTADEEEVFLSGEEVDDDDDEGLPPPPPPPPPPMRPGRGPDEDPPEPRRFGEPRVVTADDMRALALTGEAGFGSVPVVVVVGMRLLNHPPIRFPAGGD